MKFYSKIIGFIVAMSISMSSFGGLFSLGVKITKADSTKKDMESMIKLVQGMYTNALADAGFAKPCKSDDGTNSSGLSKPVDYVATTGYIGFVKTQTSAVENQVYTPGELSSGLDAGMRKQLNDFGITKCMWAFAIFHNTDTLNYGDKSSSPTAFTNLTSRGSLAQTAFIFDPPRDAAGKVSGLETVSVYTTLQNDSGTSLSSTKLDNADVIKGYTSGVYVTGQCGTLVNLFNPANLTGTTAAVKKNTCPMITCGLAATATGVDHLVHRTIKPGSTMMANFGNGSTMCGDAT